MSKRTSSSSHVPTPGSTSNDNRLYNATPNNLYGTNQIYDSNISQARHIYDESLGEDDVDGIKALLRTGDAQIDMGDFSDAFRGRDPSNMYNDDDTKISMLWKNSAGNYEENSRYNRNLPTLGQMADQIQAKARAEGRVSKSSAVNADDDIGDDGDDGDGEGGGFIAAGQEHTGRWTKEEHELFLKALEKYGKEWKRVASMVKTRTVVQTRTHAQKYFQKKLKSGENLGGFDYTNLDSPNITPKISPSNPSHSSSVAGTNAQASEDKRQNPSGLTVSIPNKRARRGQDDVEDHGIILPPALMNTAHPPMPGTSPYFMLPPGSLMLAPQAMSNQPILSHVNVMSPQFPYQRHLSPGMPLHLQMPNQIMPQGPTLFDSPTSWGGWNLPPPPPPDQYLPQPSPAATGRRKHAELAVAATLAATASSEPDFSDKNGHDNATEDVLSILSTNIEESKRVTESHLAAFTERTLQNDSSSRIPSDNPSLTPSVHSNVHSTTDEVTNTAPAPSRIKRGPSLSIINPDLLENPLNKSARTVIAATSGTLSNPGFMTTPKVSKVPSTPWDEDVKTLHLQGNASMISPPIFTPGIHLPIASHTNASSAASQSALTSQEIDFMARLRQLIFANDVNGAIGCMDTFIANLNATPSSSAAGSRNRSTSTTPSSASVSPYGLVKPLAHLLNRCLPPPYDTISSPPNNHMEADTTSLPLLLDICQRTPSDVDESTIKSICALLIERGASVNSTNPANGQSCLHITAKRGYDTVGRLILNKGCQINLQDMNGDTAVHIASKYGHVHFVEMLLELGAQCHVHNQNSLSALDVAGLECDDKAVKRLELRSRMFQIESRLRTLILYHEECLAHTPRRKSDWEAPDRLTAIMERLRSPYLFQHHEIEISSAFERASVDLLSRVHSSDYITFVNNLSHNVNEGDTQAFTPQVQKLLYNQSANEVKQSEYSDTSFSIGTLQAARRAAGSVAYAVDCILLGRNRNAFCCVRPPGHHAGYRGLLDGNAKSCGFCIFNSVAAGALHALEVRHCQRVAIVDLDIHHGNGTEDIVKRFPEPSRLFFFSLHLFDKDMKSGYEFFPGSGASDDVVHNIINIPIMPLWKDKEAESDNPVSSLGILMGRDGYRQAISKRLIPSLRAFNPSLILLSTGFDGCADDVGNQRTLTGSSRTVMKGIDLQPEDFAWVTTEIMRVADLCCNGRLVSVLEGGYGCVASQPVPQKPRTRESNKNSHPGKAVQNTSNNGYSSASQGTGSEGFMNRSSLVNAAMLHVSKLVDPYETVNT